MRINIADEAAGITALYFVTTSHYYLLKSKITKL